MPATPPREMLETMANLAETHHEHEKFYSQSPLRLAAETQTASRILKALAAHWSEAVPTDHPAGNPYAGAQDLNAPGLTGETGVLFMEGEEEPTEISQLKRDLETTARDMEAASEWLARAMEQSWGIAGAAGAFPALADLLGERHRIIANDWQAAELQALIARLLHRSLDLLNAVDLSPDALRSDLAGDRTAPGYLFSASELIDHATDLMAESAILVHDNERRWRVFSERVRGLLAEQDAGGRD